MQKHEVDQARMICFFGLPLAGVVGGFYLAFRGIPGILPPAASDSPIAGLLLIGGAVLGVVLGVWLAKTVKEYCDDGFRGERYHKFLRGTQMVNWHTLVSMINRLNFKENKKRKKQGLPELSPVTIGHVPMPLLAEDRHTLTSASIGSGKSVATEHAIASVIRRRDKCVVVDPNGTFYSKFGFPGDRILNPFDSRTEGWTLFNEIKGVHDFNRMAKSIIPPQVDMNTEQWCVYARDMLADTMRKLYETGNPDQETLVDILVRADAETIQAFLKNTDSAGYFRQDAEKATASVQFLINQYVRPLRYMHMGRFSLYNWLHDPSPGNLFITWREDMRETQKPLVAAWVDTICATILSAEPRQEKRLWLFLEELESLGKLNSLVPAATKGRKHGLRIWATIQDWAQMDAGYGINDAKTLLACFRNYLILGASNAYNAHRASEILGKHQVTRWHISDSAGAKGSGKSKSLNASNPEFVVMDSEIASLKDLDGYVLFSEDTPMAKITLPFVDYPIRNQALCMST
jgi:type IV secretory pathway TraG/TraD family ATPase VirD4